jgi:hypothetical protein
VIARDILSITRDGRTLTDIPYIIETLRVVPTLVPRKPTLGNSLPSCYVKTDEEVTGCIVTRLTPRAVPELLYLTCGEVTEEGHEIGSRNLYFQDLAVSQNAPTEFTVEFRYENRIRQYPDLQVVGFTLRGEYDSALELKIDIQGIEEEITQTQDALPDTPLERYFFNHHSQVSLNDDDLDDVVAFELEGNYDYDQVGEKRLSFRVRRRELNDSDFSSMRNPVTFTLQCHCPWEYEEGFSACFEFTLDTVFEGEESFRDDQEVQSREFRYLVTTFTCRCYLTGEMR